MNKIVLVAALGVGYVLGSRAGRERYDRLSSSARYARLSSKAQTIWSNPKVRREVIQESGSLSDEGPSRTRPGHVDSIASVPEDAGPGGGPKE